MKKSKIEIQKWKASILMVITLSNQILLITNEFSIKFATFVWMKIFEISLHSRDTGYDSFFGNILYDSHMSHNIGNIHIIRREILNLIQ